MLSFQIAALIFRYAFALLQTLFGPRYHQANPADAARASPYFPKINRSIACATPHSLTSAVI